MNRIAACGLSLLLAASLHATPAQAVAPGDGVADSSCGADMDLVAVAETKDFNPGLGAANGTLLVAASGTAARPESTERRVASGAVVQQAQWIRRIDNPVAEPGILVLLVAGFLGMWAMARRRNLSS